MSLLGGLWSPEVTTDETITMTPFGTIESTTVQDALEEIVGEQNTAIYVANLLVANQLGAL